VIAETLADGGRGRTPAGGFEKVSEGFRRSSGSNMSSSCPPMLPNEIKSVTVDGSLKKNEKIIG
jgi:hypothetical protein